MRQYGTGQGRASWGSTLPRGLQGWRGRRWVTWGVARAIGTGVPADVRPPSAAAAVVARGCSGRGGEVNNAKRRGEGTSGHR